MAGTKSPLQMQQPTNTMADHSAKDREVVQDVAITESAAVSVAVAVDEENVSASVGKTTSVATSIAQAASEDTVHTGANKNSTVVARKPRAKTKARTSPHTLLLTDRDSYSYQVLRKIGSGAYGKVFAVYQRPARESKKPVESIPLAVKVPIKFQRTAIHGLSCLTELDLMSRCHHPFILRLHRVELDFPPRQSVLGVVGTTASGTAGETAALPASFPAVLPSCQVTDAHGQFKKARYDRLAMVFELAIGNTEDLRIQEMSDDKLRISIAQALLALEYLHRKQILHRDLKPSNILLCPADSNHPLVKMYMEHLRPGNAIAPSAYRRQLNEYLAVPQNTVIKLCDFGMSKICTNWLETKGVVTLWYRAPEIASNGKERYTFTSDWWSFGCILFEWVTGTPFAALSVNNNANDEQQDVALLQLIRSNLARLEATDWDQVQNALKARVGFTKDEKRCIVNLIKSFLKVRPEERISPSEALESMVFHPLRAMIDQNRVRLPEVTLVDALYRTNAASSNNGGELNSPLADCNMEEESQTRRSEQLEDRLAAQMSPSLADPFKQCIARLQQNREVAFVFARELHRTRHERQRYHTSRRLFLALELFDRFCRFVLEAELLPNESDGSPKQPDAKTVFFLQAVGFGQETSNSNAAASSSAMVEVSSASSAAVLTQSEKVGTLFLLLYYISIKYLSSFDSDIGLKHLLAKKVAQDRTFTQTFFEELELFLVQQVFEYQIGPNRVIRSKDNTISGRYRRNQRGRHEWTYLNFFETACFDERRVPNCILQNLCLWKEKFSFLRFVEVHRAEFDVEQLCQPYAPVAASSSSWDV